MSIASAVPEIDRLTVLNPADESVIELVDVCRRPELDAAVEECLHAFPAWRTSSSRRDVLRACAAALRRRSAAFELAALVTLEQGKPKREALNEVYAAAHWFQSLAELELPVETRPVGERQAQIRRDPLGVVAAITPWNYPVLLAASKIAAALVSGNVVLLKPSPHTPLSTRRLAEIVTEPAGPLPRGVISVLLGGEELGGWMVDDPRIAHVSFTGSTAVGRRVWEAAARTMKTVTLELGGNDAAVVLEDADVDEIVEPLFWSAFQNAGQFCAGVKRLYVHERVFERIVAGLVARAERTVVGDGRHPRTEMGPVAYREHLRRIEQLVEQAVAAGARVRAGGCGSEGPGFFFRPTVLTDVGEGQPVVAEEQFGPVLPVLPFREVDDVLTRVNNSPFGLGASVWSGDRGRAAGLAGELQCGTVWINHHGALDPLVPFAGHKQSGVGCENGAAGAGQLTRLQVVMQ